MIPCACNNYSLCYTGYQYITITFNIDWLENQFELRYQSAPAEWFSNFSRIDNDDDGK
jgi:hypothetical protein